MLMVFYIFIILQHYKDFKEIMQQQIKIKDKIKDIKNNKIIKKEDNYIYKDKII